MGSSYKVIQAVLDVAAKRLPAGTEKKKEIGERETEEFGERSDRGGTGEAPSLRWGSPGACSQASAKPVRRRTVGVRILGNVL